MTVAAPHNEREALAQRSDEQEQDHALRLLSHLAVSLGHGVEFDFLLAELATGLRRTLDADRVSVLLLDEHERLTPAIAVARQHDADLWQTFRRMPPIALDDLVGAREALSAGHVLVIDDATRSPLIPTAWQRAFRLGSLAIAPLAVDRVAAGIVVVDYAERGATFSTTDLALLEGMAALAAIAFEGARQGGQAKRAHALSAALHELASAHSRRAVAEHTLAALLEIAQVSHGLVALLEDGQVEVVAVRGSGLPEPATYDIGDVPESIRAACAGAWDDSAVIRIVPAAHTDGQPLVVVPMVARRRVVGVAVLPLQLSATSREVIAQLEVLATSCGLALRASRNTREREWLARALALSSPGQLAGKSPTELIDNVRDLLADAGVTVAGVFAERSVARLLGVAQAPAGLGRRIAQWQRTGNPQPVDIDTNIAWPLVSNGHPLGAIVTPANLSARSRERLRTGADVLAVGLAEALDRARIADLERLAAEAASHRLVAVRAYREAGQVLGLLSEQLRSGSAGDPRVMSATRVVVEQAKRLVRDATSALAPEDAKQPGLRAALSAAAESVHAAGGPEVVVRQRGHLVPVDSAVQVALVRAARRLLILLRDQRAATVSVQAESADGQTVVRLRAAQLLRPLDAEEVGAHSAMSEVRSWLEPVAGSAHFQDDGQDRLYVLTAPTDFRRSERSIPSGPLHEDSGEVVRLKR